MSLCYRGAPVNRDGPGSLETGMRKPGRRGWVGRVRTASKRKEPLLQGSLCIIAFRSSVAQLAERPAVNR